MHPVEKKLVAKNIVMLIKIATFMPSWTLMDVQLPINNYFLLLEIIFN